MPATVKNLKAFFGGIHNCTHVEGNLVIQNVYTGNSNMSSLIHSWLYILVNSDEPDLSFLSSIKEVTGYVFLRNNSISKVILPNLRVIRGQSCMDIDWYNEGNFCFSLYIDLINETFAGQAIFPSLKGKVILLN